MTAGSTIFEMWLGLQLIKDLGAESARLIVKEKEQHGPCVTAGDVVRRWG